MLQYRDIRMSAEIFDKTVAPQLELIIGRRHCLSILPSVADRFLSLGLKSRFSSPDLADIIETEPSLAAKFIWTAAQNGMLNISEEFSILNIVKNLPADAVRDTFFSLELYQPAEKDGPEKTDLRKQIITHSIAVALYAEEISKLASQPVNAKLAYAAGLLHNIGVLALDEMMPRSFAAMNRQAKSETTELRFVEQKHLGLDHSLVGKRLAVKWQLPEEIVLAIWLHSTEIGSIVKDISRVKIARIVQLADFLACRNGFAGAANSHQSDRNAEEIASLLTINNESLEQIGKGLAAEIRDKRKVAGLDFQGSVPAYCAAVHSAAGQLSSDNTKLSGENKNLRISCGSLNFLQDLLESLNPDAPPVELAEKIALCWQKCYQTGPVCVCLNERPDSGLIEVAIAESPGQSRMVCLNSPPDSAAVHPAKPQGFYVSDAGEYGRWLSEQLDMVLEPARNKLVRLFCDGRPTGTIVFELRQPAEPAELTQIFEVPSLVAGGILGMAAAAWNKQRFAEVFAAARAVPQRPQPAATADILTALAEMAAGAAHELNNPLSVISGRVQQLFESETDSEKKQMLRQIQDSTDEISRIIDELMSFARPENPKPADTDIKLILNDARDLTVQKIDARQSDIRIETDETAREVFVDPAQIASAIANVFSNAVESYPDKSGPVEVEVTTAKNGDFLEVNITDHGCGMDRETVQKATEPFFSARPAGRKRGMGLAYAGRVIQLNKGRLTIESLPDRGTTVTVLLPCK